MVAINQDDQNLQKGYVLAAKKLESTELKLDQLMDKWHNALLKGSFEADNIKEQISFCLDEIDFYKKDIMPQYDSFN